MIWFFSILKEEEEEEVEKNPTIFFSCVFYTYKFKSSKVFDFGIQTKQISINQVLLTLRSLFAASYCGNVAVFFASSSFFLLLNTYNIWSDISLIDVCKGKRMN